LFKKDSLITLYYNKKLANGKWNHFMDQVHIGYKIWNDPKVNSMPEVKYVPDNAAATVTPEAATEVKTAISRATTGSAPVFYEKNGYVSIASEHYTRAVNTNGIQWTILPDIGREGSGITPFPVTASKQDPGNNSPHVEYDFYTYEDGTATVQAYFSPTLNFHNEADGLRYAVSIDDETPQIIGMNAYTDANVWRGWVANNIIVATTLHNVLKPGKHVLKFWMADPGIVLQKMVIDLGGLKKSYLGPKETIMDKQ